ncbi:MAG: hypothetical protein DRJ52_01180 [Thermoprotei archaeon]|nr:MAG: hypothetical protein DRJ52_01180 [Thermoprotei archaeon]RLF01189.1 MAG: hypothetical protein DRJ63_00360 [Thermoprotei archaeon]
MALKNSKARRVVFTAIGMALVFLGTVAISVYIPETRGYFNIGESMVYTIALLFGPSIGGIAGGLGSALADIALGYYHYAPATFAIKFIEGFLAGYIYRKLKKYSERKLTIIGFVVPAGLLTLGTYYYSAYAELTFFGLATMGINVAAYLWIIAAIVVALIFIYFIYKKEYEVSVKVMALGIAGLEMVLGYFLYEYYVLGFGPGSLAEVPFNIMQMIVGSTIAIPLTEQLKKIVKEIF